jgi:copper chaperone CopZ
MNKKTPNKILLAAILLLWSTILLHATNIDPDIEIKIKGLVCPSCGIGIKNGLQKTRLVKEIKFNTKKQLCLVEYISLIEIHPSQIKKIVKDAGYEVVSIRWLKEKKPNRYNKP